MKPLKTKAQIRAELEQQVNSFIKDGGAVHDIPSGISGYAGNENPFSHYTRTDGPPQERTPLGEIVKQLDARKSPHKNPIKPPRRPRRKLITDDFGEPVRWVWVDGD